MSKEEKSPFEKDRECYALVYSAFTKALTESIPQLGQHYKIFRTDVDLVIAQAAVRVAFDYALGKAAADEITQQGSGVSASAIVQVIVAIGAAYESGLLRGAADDTDHDDSDFGDESDDD